MADRVLVPLPDGRWLALTQEGFRAALEAGAEAMPAKKAAAPAPEAEGLELVTAKALAGQTRLPISCLYEYAKAGRIPCVRVGKHVRFSPAAVLAALAATSDVTVGRA